MKLPRKIAIKVKEYETEIRKELGDDFYNWVTNPETEIRDYSTIDRLMVVLKKHVK